MSYITRTTLHITAREFRAHMAEVIKRGEPRVLGTRLRAKCIIMPVPPQEWHGRVGMDKRMRDTRALFEQVMSHLEH
jgi:hypothetical protein